MKTSQAGINLIKQFEGCRLQAYKPVAAEQYYTIGYGHYGPDVLPNMSISQDVAEALLKKDLEKFERAVEKYTPFPMSQNQFDALVSFAYNCGAGNLQKLVKDRNASQVATAMLSYNKGSGKVLPGLVKRRQMEHDLFLKSSAMPATGNPYPEPAKAVKLNSRGNDVRWLQYELNKAGGYKLIVDGIAGQLTIASLIDFQKTHGLDPDGICGPKTREALTR